MSDAEQAFDNFLGVKEEPASPSRSQLPGFLERDQVSIWSRSQNRWVEDGVVTVVHRRDQHRDGFFLASWNCDGGIEILRHRSTAELNVPTFEFTDTDGDEVALRIDRNHWRKIDLYINGRACFTSELSESSSSTQSSLHDVLRSQLPVVLQSLLPLHRADL